MDIVEAIDRATGCQQCGKSLGPSPSDDFCGEGCQQAWQAKRVGAPFSHWLGIDCARLADPAAAELVFPRVPVPHVRLHRDGTLEMLVRPDARALSGAFGRMSESLAGLMRGMSGSASRASEAVDSLLDSFEVHAAQRAAMDKALEARRTRNTGPSSAARAPRSISPRRTR